MSLITFPEIRCGEKSLSLGTKVLIMGILNVTPDSFSDGGRFLDPVLAVDQAQKMVAEGADMIDIGGESTRPGADYVSEEEETARIRPIIKALGKCMDIPLSIDTRKAGVAQMAVDCGASIVNDVSAMRDDPRMAQVIQKSGAGVVLMHRQGHSGNMQHHPAYEDVVGEVKEFLAASITRARSAGIASNRIMIDPGIGFGKTITHNLRILANLGELLELEQPLMVGLSRKAFIGELTGKPVMERETGNAAAIALAVWQGVHILRVHEVGAMKEAIQVAQGLRNSCDK
ncbi:MAG: dihydropteroate synthase [Nitrospirota bacterium]|nr:dihydropteroate synthase [Nitrospirota bacterium]